MGLNGVTMTMAIAADMDLDEQVKGVLITDIVRGGAAHKAGLNGTYQQIVGPGVVGVTYGDVITAIDGQPLRTYEDLVSYIFNQTEVGQTVSLTILRDWKEETVSIKLAGE